MYHIFNNVNYLKQIILTYKLKLILSYHIYIFKIVLSMYKIQNYNTKKANLRV